MSEAPTEDLRLSADTAPFPALPLDATCAWCNAPLRAVPSWVPTPYQSRDTGVIAYYHPIGCVAAARNAEAGIRSAV